MADLPARTEASEREVVNYASQKGIVAMGTTKSADGKNQVERTIVSNDLEALNAAWVEAIANRIAMGGRERSRSGCGNPDTLAHKAIS